MGLDNRTISYIASALLLVCGIFYIAANASPTWSKVSVESISITTGLWKICLSECVAISSNTGLSSSAQSKNTGARALVTISCILWALAIAAILATLFVDENAKKSILLVAKGLAIACLVSGIIGVALGISFATTSDDSSTGFSPKISVAGILGIIALLFNLIGAIATFFIK